MKVFSFIKDRRAKLKQALPEADSHSVEKKLIIYNKLNFIKNTG